MNAGKKSRNRFKMFMMFILCSVIIIMTFMPFSTNRAALPVDDEKESAMNCIFSFQKVKVTCYEGTIDCNPRDCP
jgi:hypothetical protein